MTPEVRIVHTIDLRGLDGLGDASARGLKRRGEASVRIVVDRSAWSTTGLPKMLAAVAAEAEAFEIEADDPWVARSLLELMRPYLADYCADGATPRPRRET